MENFSLDSRFQNAQVDIKLLRYILVLLKISKEDLKKITRKDTDECNLTLPRQNTFRCKKCTKLFKYTSDSTK